VGVYAPSSNAWAKLAPLPHPRYRFAAVPRDGRIYAIGGSIGATGDVNAANAAYATLFSFDGHAWHPSPPLLQGTEDAAATLEPDGRVYVAGGFDNGWLTTVQTYDPVAEQWALGRRCPLRGAVWG